MEKKPIKILAVDDVTAVWVDFMLATRSGKVKGIEFYGARTPNQANQKPAKKPLHRMR